MIKVDIDGCMSEPYTYKELENALNGYTLIGELPNCAEHFKLVKGAFMKQIWDMSDYEVTLTLNTSNKTCKPTFYHIDI